MSKVLYLVPHLRPPQVFEGNFTNLKNKTVQTKSASFSRFFFNSFKASHLTYNLSCGPFESGIVAWLTFDKPVCSWQHWSVVYLIWSEPAYGTHKEGLSYCFEKQGHVNCRAERRKMEVWSPPLSLKVVWGSFTFRVFSSPLFVILNVVTRQAWANRGFVGASAPHRVGNRSFFQSAARTVGHLKRESGAEIAHWYIQSKIKSQCGTMLWHYNVNSLVLVYYHPLNVKILQLAKDSSPKYKDYFIISLLWSCYKYV